MLTLAVSNLHWIKDASGDPLDLCAHGIVDLRIDDVVIPELVSYDCTVSAAALYLLRSLSRPHKRGTGEHLFPCCGFSMYDVPEQDDVLILGCPIGVDLDILHEPSAIAIGTAGSRLHRVSETVWRAAVFAFADRVSQFYRTSSPKRPSSDDTDGFRKFLREWHARRGTSLLETSEEERFKGGVPV